MDEERFKNPSLTFPFGLDVDMRRHFDDAEGMHRLVAFISCVLAGTGLAGCSGSAAAPRKVIATSPDGPAKVLPLTAAARPMTWPTSTVAPAAYEEPLPARPAFITVPVVKPLAEWTEQDVAADALGRIGAAAVPALIEGLRSPDPAVRLKAVEVLGRMGPDAKDAVPDLVRLLDDPEEPIRRAATRTLGRIGPPAQEAVPALVRTLLQPTP
jgi:hypothetical protein